jgi:hypothetical protein
LLCCHHLMCTSLLHFTSSSSTCEVRQHTRTGKAPAQARQAVSTRRTRLYLTTGRCACLPGSQLCASCTACVCLAWQSAVQLPLASSQDTTATAPPDQLPSPPSTHIKLQPRVGRDGSSLLAPIAHLWRDHQLALVTHTHALTAAAAAAGRADSATSAGKGLQEAGDANQGASCADNIARQPHGQHQARVCMRDAGHCRQLWISWTYQPVLLLLLLVTACCCSQPQGPECSPPRHGPNP